MEQFKNEKQEITPQTVEEAVKMFVSGDLGEDGAINYLRENRNEITEFCLQTYEAYQDGDNSGIIRISILLGKAL
ncbi:MAG: hypothetical protein GXP44_02910 [bacterium]|nr:hypothetical protein [bacterium]